MKLNSTDITEQFLLDIRFMEIYKSGGKEFLEPYKKLEALLKKIDGQLTADTVKSLDQAEKELLVRICIALGLLDECKIIFDSGYSPEEYVQVGCIGDEKPEEEEDKAEDQTKFSDSESSETIKYYYPPLSFIAVRFGHFSIIDYLIEKLSEEKQFFWFYHPNEYQEDSEDPNPLSDPYHFLFDLSDVMTVPENVFEVVAMNGLEPALLEHIEAKNADGFETANSVDDLSFFTRAIFCQRDSKEPNPQLVRWLIDSARLNRDRSTDGEVSFIGAALLDSEILADMLSFSGKKKVMLEQRPEPGRHWLPKKFEMETACGETLLGACAYYGLLEETKMLIDKGAQVDSVPPGKFGYTALHLACCLASSKELTPYGLHLRNHELHGAIDQQSIEEILKLVISHTTSATTLNRKDFTEKTALQTLLQHAQVILFDKTGKKIGTADDIQFITSLLKLLLNAGAGVGICLDIGYKPLLKLLATEENGFYNFFVGAHWSDNKGIVKHYNILKFIDEADKLGIYAFVDHLMKNAPEVFKRNVEHIAPKIRGFSGYWSEADRALLFQKIENIYEGEVVPQELIEVMVISVPSSSERSESAKSGLAGSCYTTFGQHSQKGPAAAAGSAMSLLDDESEEDSDNDSDNDADYKGDCSASKRARF